jgi:hypothetical protein
MTEFKTCVIIMRKMEPSGAMRLLLLHPFYTAAFLVPAVALTKHCSLPINETNSSTDKPIGHNGSVCLGTKMYGCAA